MQAFYSDQYELPLPPGHRFPMAKYRLLRDRLAVELPELRLLDAPPASAAELALAHEPRYIGAVLDGSLEAELLRDIGFPWSPHMAERARRSVGATIAAARAALADGAGANLAGGTHHASAARGAGFCVFNDIAVAARVMQAERLRTHEALLRVAVIDLDVHQGDGTASIFRDEPSVFTLSLHGERNFPFVKEASDIDVALPDDCRDDAYLQALDAALAEMWRRHADAPPGLVFYLAGADPHEDDRLGRLRLSARGLAERDRRVFAACAARALPVVLTMGGGYGRDLAAMVELQLATFREALGHWRAWRAALGLRREVAAPVTSAESMRLP